MIEALLFDLDGTLLDSMGMWSDIDRRFLLSRGVTPPDWISDHVKTLSIEAAAAFFVDYFHLDCNAQTVIDEIEALAAEAYENTLPLKPGVRAVLDAADAAGLPCVVVTATYNRLVEAALDRHGLLERFRFVLTCTDVNAPKTQPTIFLEAARRLGIFEPGHCLVVEDSLHALETAAAAGFATAAVLDDLAKADWPACQAIAALAPGDLFSLAHWLQTNRNNP